MPRTFQNYTTTKLLLSGSLIASNLWNSPAKSQLSSYLIMPPPLIQFPLLASSTRRPLAFPPGSLDTSSQVHWLVSPLHPDLSVLECPRDLDTHGEPATSCHPFHPHPVQSHHLLSLGYCTSFLLVPQLPPFPCRFLSMEQPDCKCLL